MEHAQWVADLMAADGVTPDQVTPELAIAYLDEVGRKIRKIQNIALTRESGKQAISDYVFLSLTC